MTSVIGLDVGNLNAKIGVARNRGIDIIVNEVSNRATPTLIGFGPRTRTLGEAAKTQETSNFRNTIGSLRRLIGRSFNDADIQNLESKFINAELVDVKGTVGVKVQYLGEDQVFTATQLYAMILGKLRDTVANETKAAVNDVVIAVPGYYTDPQRRAVLDAAEIAGLNPLRLVNECTATALGYGITRSDLPAPEEKPRHVAFVDIGNSDYSVAVVAFSKGKLVVKGTAYDRHFGGRDFDYALMEHFAQEFKGKYKIDVTTNKKAQFRLATAVERLRKILSANTQAPLNVESIMNDIDVASSLSRDDFEGLIAPLLDRTVVPLEQALKQAGLTPADIDAIELVGGLTRTPALKNRIQEFFNKPVSMTTNQDEAIARGATFFCATLSPVFKVREFEAVDIVSYPINISWEAADVVEEQTSVTIFDIGNAVPSSKSVKFFRKEPFDIEAHYTDPAYLPGSINPWIARCTVKGVHPTSSGDHSQVRLRVRMNPHGCFAFEGATLLEDVEEPETIDDAAPTGPPTPEPGSAPNGETPAKKVKKVTKKELVTIVGTNSLEPTILQDYRQKEGEMHESDKLVADTEDRKNALEEYIYDAREKIDGAYAAYVSPDAKTKFQSLLDAAESWLYSEEGEDATKSAYVAKLTELKALGDPIGSRYRENEDRPRAIKSLRETIQSFLDKASSGDDRYSHIPDADKEKIIEKAATTEKWLTDNTAKQAERGKDQDVVFTSTEINKKREEVTYFCSPILNKPKPPPPKTTSAPETKPSTPAPEPPASKQTDGTPEVEMDAGPGGPSADAPVVEEKMDVD